MLPRKIINAFSLIEVLIVTVILSIGLLNIALLQQKALQLARDSENYATAALLAQEMANRLQTNYPEALNNNGGQYLNSHASINTASGSPQFAAKIATDPAADNSSTLNATLPAALTACYAIASTATQICSMGNPVPNRQGYNMCGSQYSTLAQAKSVCLTTSTCGSVVFTSNGLYGIRCGGPVYDTGDPAYVAWGKNCATCPPASLATVDLYDWKYQLQNSLPNGYGIVCYDSSNPTSLICDGIGPTLPTFNNGFFTASYPPSSSILTIKITWTMTNGISAIYTSKTIISSPGINYF